MEDKKRRRKTGCLTCRLRRVKCDEERPMCHRCLAANLECAGYEERRRLDTEKLRRTSSKRQQCDVPGPVDHRQLHNRTTEVRIPDLVVQQREDGLPLIGLPVNPTSSQRPHTRARDILAYHQFLFRTLPILFPAQHMYFWRDYLCQLCWDIEYVYDAITALGSMHRAVLMLSQSGQNDQNRGLDTKVIACQAYTRALQEMANVEKNTPYFVGVTVFCAYFECFAGNVLAAARHFYTAKYLVRFVDWDSKADIKVHGIAIASALRDLALVCAINLPFLSQVPSTQFSKSIDPRPTRKAPFDYTMQSFAPMAEMLQDLLNLGTEDAETQDLLWNPVAVCLTPMSIEKVRKLNDRLNEWRGTLAILLLSYDLELPLLPPSSLTWDICRQLPMPPLPYPVIPFHLRLILSLYNFYAARVKWTESVIVRDDNQGHELKAYFYFYQQLRLASIDLSTSATTRTKLEGQQTIAQDYHACECVKMGFSPLLYLAGQCCQRMPNWIEWITHKLSEIGQEGIFNGQIYAMNLKALDRFRRLSRIDSTDKASQYAQNLSNQQIVLSLLIPFCRRRAYSAYYIRSSSRHNKRTLNASENQNFNTYDVVGITGWGDGSCDLLDMTIDNENEAFSRPLDTKWLLSLPIMQEWSLWLLDPEFRADRVLADHIVGGSLDRNSEYKYTEVALHGLRRR